MKVALFFLHRGRSYVAGILFSLTVTPCLAAPALIQQIDPPEANVGDQVTVSITVQNGSVRVGDVHLPAVDGLQVLGTSIQIKNIDDNGVMTSAVSFSYILTPTRGGDFTIPAFDVHLQDGGNLHSQPMKLHVLSSGTAPPSSTPTPSNPNTAPVAPQLPAFNPNGPVVMPPNTPPAPDAAVNSAGNPDNNGPNQNVPRESDGRPAKVFIVITLQTTDSYVGETIPMRIEFYLRGDVVYRQNSLPTIMGSDFLMNDLPMHFNQDVLVVADEQYLRQTWITAISAPKTGDFPLQMERDTYWMRANNNPFANSFFNPGSVAHEMIDSNKLTVHVHPLPTEGRPANFTGAIGQLKVTGTAGPGSVAVGEPVTLHFAISGEGNFDYVRCPSLADSPDWKSYVATSKMEYLDESHTQGTKTFEQAVIPQKNGTLSLPKASFSYFNPTSRQYVTIPVELPPITVTGTVAAATPPPVAAAASPDAPPKPMGPFPNRPFIGSLQPNLSPVYRQAWFWAAQGGLLYAVAMSGLLVFARSRKRPEDLRAERLQREQSLHKEEDAMGEAARLGDVLAFFTSARHAIQLQLGARWNLRPEALTLAEIQQHDPQLAEVLQPLFAQADEVIYSGLAGGKIDLAQWDRHVRQLLQSQPQPA